MDDFAHANVMLNQPITDLSGIGSRLAAQFARLGIETVGDLIFHLPSRYEDRTQIVPMAQLQVGEHALVVGTLEECQVRQGQRKRSLLCALSDATGQVMLRFFHFNTAQQRQFSPGTRLRCFGEVRQGHYGVELIHPDYKLLHDDDDVPTEAFLTPIYPSCEGLQQNQIRKAVQQALAHIALNDVLPAAVLQHYRFLSLQDTLHFLHTPPNTENLDVLAKGKHPVQRRLAFEEILAQHLSLRQLREHSEQNQAPVLESTGELQQRLCNALPFQLTGAQQRVCAEIQAELNQAKPMQRLIQGDVGSGKTIVAALSALQAVEAGYQVAVMAPTELLAEQHYNNFSQWMLPLNLRLAWLSGSLTKKQREQTLAALANGDLHIAVGTHALVQDAVQFYNLGLVIIDEQHRFGVHQRLALRNKGQQLDQVPHQLIMTATPIPRTLAMTAYADLALSVIDELPQGRQPVNTVVIPNTRRDEIVQRIAHACSSGKQAYWVCTLVEESDVLQCQAAEDSATQLQESLPNVRVGLVHGRMKAKEKELVMLAFKQHELDLLVATTVIEVGVDVPNASLMIIENAERLGLAQLHQLRGRVGRGSVQSHCVLLYQTPLSKVATQRLAILRDTHDGFVIAQKDLEIRGPGEVLGTRQTGVLRLRIADLQRDADMLDAVNEVATWLLRDFPTAVAPLINLWVREEVEFKL